MELLSPKLIEQAKFKPLYFGFTLGVSTLVGLASGILADQSWEISFLAGYTGTDFLVVSATCQG